jgi:hypothetical protein
MATKRYAAPDCATAGPQYPRPNPSNRFPMAALGLVTKGSHRPELAASRPTPCCRAVIRARLPGSRVQREVLTLMSRSRASGIWQSKPCRCLASEVRGRSKAARQAAGSQAHDGSAKSEESLVLERHPPSTPCRSLGALGKTPNLEANPRGRRRRRRWSSLDGVKSRPPRADGFKQRAKTSELLLKCWSCWAGVGPRLRFDRLPEFAELGLLLRPLSPSSADGFGD